MTSSFMLLCWRAKMPPEIEVDKDYIVVCGSIVPRPSSISPSQWTAYWETAKEWRDLEEIEEEAYQRGHRDAVEEYREKIDA